MRIRILLLTLVCLTLVAENSVAASWTVSGYVNDPLNSHLVGADLGAALFGDDFEIANNVALHTISLGGGVTTFTSQGFALGGIDPYFSLFSGSGSAATFVDSNYFNAFSVGGDFAQSFNLAAGVYTVAIGTFANQPRAENPGVDLSLGAGFTGLGGPSFLGNYYYQFHIEDSSVNPVPEAASLSFLAVGLAGAALQRFRRK